MKTIQAVKAPAPAVTAPLFTPEDAKQCATDIDATIDAPYVRASVSTLGGVRHASILFTISVDPKESWTNGILQNSRYGNFRLEMDGTLEMFSGSLPRFRRRKVKNWAAFFKAMDDLLQPLRPKPKDESEYRRLDKAADDEQKEGKLDRDLHYQISGIIDSARVNADDTVYKEKAQPEGQWNSIFLGSIGTLLSDRGIDPKITDWFKANGVQW